MALRTHVHRSTAEIHHHILMSHTSFHNWQTEIRQLYEKKMQEQKAM